MMRYLCFITGEIRTENKENKDFKENKEVRCFPRFLELPLFSLALVIALLPAGALAQDPCAFVPGGCPPQDIVQAHLIPTLASLFLRLTGGLAIIFIIWANIQILFSWGDEGKIASARQSMLYGALGIGLALLSQLLISFLVTEAQNLGTLGPVDLDLTLMASTVRVMLLAFNVIMGVMIFIAGLRMVLAHGKTDDYDKAKTLLTWSIIAAVLTNLSHFVVQIIVTSLT